MPKENLGYAKGNNLGLSKAITKYALVLNPDTTLNPDTLKNFFQTADKYKDFSLIGPYSVEQKYTKKNKRGGNSK